MSWGKGVLCAPERIDRPITVDVFLTAAEATHLWRLPQTGL